MRDNRGTELQVGQRVVYNISGEVAAGIIVELTEGRYEEPYPGAVWRRCLKQPMIKVRLLHDAAGKDAGHVSKVRESKNVLVLRTVEA